MDFKEYYRNKEIVESYDDLRMSGIKGKLIRMLELKFVDFLVEQDKKQKILEIGLGTGFISGLLIKKGKFYGMDISEEMLNKVRKRLGKVKLMRGDILNIKIKEKFDKVVTIRVISHFKKKDTIKALKNIDKILEKQGRIIFNLENISYLRRFLRKLTKWGSTYTYQYSKAEVFKIVEEAGFKVDKILYLDHFFILPLHIINKIFWNKFENLILRTEFKLKEFPLMASNFFIKCRK